MKPKSRIILIGLVSVLLVGPWAYALYLRADLDQQRAGENRRVARLVCEESNRLREALRGAGILIVETAGLNPEPPGGSTRTPDVRARSMRSYMDKAFRGLDCNSTAALDEMLMIWDVNYRK